MKTKMLMGVLLCILVAQLMVLPVEACRFPRRRARCVPQGDLTIEKTMCGASHGIQLNTKYYWSVKIKVTVDGDPGDTYRWVRVYDRLGGEFMIAKIFFGDDEYLIKYPTATGYTNIPERGNRVEVHHEGVKIADGHLDRRGVRVPGKFRLFWTGKTCKVHIRLYLGKMVVGTNDEAEITLKIQTDVNPGGHQEFTSPGTYCLNSGAVVKAFYRWRQVTDTSSSLFVTVGDC
jgi:hypothetical protein